MTSLALVGLLQVSLMTVGADAYNDAHKQAVKNSSPLVVLVGAEWCPGCRTMKHAVIPQAKQQGILNPVAFAVVDYDANPALAQKLMRGGSIPQLIIFTPTETGWKRDQITGATSVGELSRVIDTSRKQAAAATAAKMKAAPSTASVQTTSAKSAAAKQ